MIKLIELFKILLAIKPIELIKRITNIVFVIDAAFILLKLIKTKVIDRITGSAWFQKVKAWFKKPPVPPMAAATLILLLCSCACKPIAYVSDLSDAFISSGMAGTPQYLVMINGKVCKDSDGQQGGCYLKYPWNKPTVIDILSQPYAYTFKLTCSEWITVNPGTEHPSQLEMSIEADKPVKFTIPVEWYNEEVSFTCIGRIYPRDRPEPMSAFFEFRSRLFDPAFRDREAVYFKDGVETFGEHALYTKILNDEAWEDLKPKTTQMRTKKPVIAFSESANMRYNSNGL